MDLRIYTVFFPIASSQESTLTWWPQNCCHSNRRWVFHCCWWQECTMGMGERRPWPGEGKYVQVVIADIDLASGDNFAQLIPQLPFPLFTLFQGNIQLIKPCRPLMRHEKNYDCILNCCHSLAQLCSNYAEIRLSVCYHLSLLLSVALKGPCANTLTAPLWSPLMLFHNDFVGPHLVVKLWVLLSSRWPPLIALTLIGGMWRHIIAF